MSDKEIFVDIKGYEGLYQISNKGNVKSLARVVIDSKGCKKPIAEKLLKKKLNSKGYERVLLSINKVHKRYFVHRLVALHFVKNKFPDVYNVVNHLDCNPLNNNADNLEWTTHKGNSQHAVRSGRMNRTKEWSRRSREAQKKFYKPVLGINPVTNKIVVKLGHINEGFKYGYFPSSISNCCKGKRKTHKGMIWKYEKDWGCVE